MAWYFIGFIFLILSLLALDLGIFNRNHRVITAKSAILWTCFWVFVSLLFNGLIFLFYDKHWLNIGTHLGFPSTGIEAFLTFLTAYLVEKSLSVDNIFVIAMVFSYFKVPAVYQHRVLFWGILGALIMRGVMIYAGIAAVSTFSWLSYVFGGLLFITAARMMVIKEENFSLEKNIVFSLLKRRFFITPDFHQHRFFVRISGKWAATPLFLALMIIESMDLLFAIDSIPAVLAITLDPFIVFTSNVFAILGMRSLYFALASLIERFRYLRTSLVFILAFVGSKMILGHHIPIDPLISLGVIMVILGIGIGASFLKAKTTEIKKKN